MVPEIEAWKREALRERELETATSITCTDYNGEDHDRAREGSGGKKLVTAIRETIYGMPPTT